MNIKFEGIMPAIFSVYDENGNVIEKTIEKMVNYQLDSGVSGFYVGGNTGECTILPNKTRKQMAEAVVKYNKGRGKIIVHVGSGILENVYDLIDHANTLDIDAIASLPPSLTSYYDEDEIIEYYKLIAKRSKHPVLAYVTSVLSSDRINFAKRLCKIDNIVGIKFSISNYYDFGKIKTILGDDLSLINGPDETLICGLIEGADGAIGTSYNAMPKLAVSIYESFKNGDVKSALEKQRKLNEYIDLYIPLNLAYWKSVLSYLGFDMGYTYAPQTLPSEEELKDLKNKLEEIEFFKYL